MTSPNSKDTAGQAGGVPIPRYFLYGERHSGPNTWFVNLEHLGDRCKDRGWRIEPHAHSSFAQIVFVRSGRGSFTIEDTSLAFESPCALLVPTHCVHGFDYESDTDGWVLTIETAYLKQINSRLPEFSQLWSQARNVRFERDAKEAHEVVSALKRLELEVESKAVGHVLAAEAVLTTLFLLLVRASQANESNEPHASSGNARLIEHYRELIDRHYRQDWRVADYASVLKVSVGQLRSACDSVCGQSPVKLIHDRLLVEAKRSLIFGDMSVEQIAYWLGFSSPAYFTRFFKKAVGQAPSAFRQISKDSAKV